MNNRVYKPYGGELVLKLAAIPQKGQTHTSETGKKSPKSVITCDVKIHYLCPRKKNRYEI